jgi:hypothetical protein
MYVPPALAPARYSTCTPALTRARGRPPLEAGAAVVRALGPHASWCWRLGAFYAYAVHAYLGTMLPPPPAWGFGQAGRFAPMGAVPRTLPRAR